MLVWKKLSGNRNASIWTTPSWAFGFDRTELEAELEPGPDADLAAGRE
jgi:hypothetical protein